MQNFAGMGLALGAIYFIALVPFALLGLAFPYAVLRLRGEVPPDPQLGTKIGLQFFYSLAILLGLVGLTVMAVDLVTRDDVFNWPAQAAGRQPNREWFNAAQRTGLALLVSGVLLALLHFLLAQGLTSRVHWPRVRRMFAGWRFAIQGLVVMFAVTALIVQISQKDPLEPEAFRSIKAIFGVLVVWMPAWAIHLSLLKVSGGRRHTEELSNE